MKRGLSDVVTTLIMILLTLVAIGMIWLIVTNILESSADEVNIGKLTLSLSIERVKVNGEMIDVTVKRNPGKGDMTGIKFVLKNDTTSVAVVENVSLNELESKTFNINTTIEGITSVNEISMNSLTKTGTGKEVPGLEYNYKITECIKNCNASKVCGDFDDCDGICIVQTCEVGYTCNSTGGCESCTTIYYRDTDGDGYGNSTSTISGCSILPNYVINSADCNDNNVSINPEAAEICDGKDNNCNNSIDEGGVCSNLSSGKYYYGSDEKQHFYLKFPGNTTQNKKLIIFVHGGRFISGNASGWSSLAKIFLDQGYIFASVDYRLCPNVLWPTPVEDMAKGVQAVSNTLNEDGIILEETTYIGFSAGSVGGALIFYSSNYSSVNNVDKFIGFGGPYSYYAMSNKADISVSACQGNLSEDLIYNAKTSVSALLIEGVNDTYDLYPETNNSHMDYLAGILNKSSVYVETFWGRKPGESCDHTCPFNSFQNREPEISSIVDNFLSM